MWVFKSPTKPCTCAPGIVTKYQERISGPIPARIDIHMRFLPSVDYEKLSGDRTGELYASIQARVQAACNTQFKRFSNISPTDIVCNADMHAGKHPILKLARTIADLADVLRYRPKLMMGHQYLEQADSVMPAVSKITLFLLTHVNLLC